MTVAVKCNITGLVLKETGRMFYGLKCQDNTLGIAENYLAYLNCPEVPIESCASDCDNPAIIFNCLFKLATLSAVVQGQTVTLNVTSLNYVGGTAPFTYQWEFNVDDFTSGATDANQLVLTLRAGKSFSTLVTSVTLTMTDANGCISSKQCWLSFGVLYCNPLYAPCVNPAALSVTPTMTNMTWDNTLVNASTNSIAQRASYRQKSIGGVWLTTGFTPTNDLPKTANTVAPPALSSNVIYEFKVEAICNSNGPTINDNGIIEALKFACIVPTMNVTDTTAEVILNVTGLDITKARFYLRAGIDGALLATSPIISRVGNSISHNVSGLITATGYFWQIELYATVNGEEIVSSSIEQFGSVCGNYSFTTVNSGREFSDEFSLEFN